MEIIIHRMAQDKEKIEKTSGEILSLNRDMENIVSERTRAERALSAEKNNILKQKEPQD